MARHTQTDPATRHQGGSGGRVRVDGKLFSAGDDRFLFRGVTYGTFAPREDGALYPERPAVKLDFAAMRETGFTVVRTYTTPPDDVVEVAADWRLRLLAGVFYPDWRYLVGASRRQQRRVARDASAAVRAAARRFAGTDEVVGLVLGNEVPADVLRWVGAGIVARLIRELVEVVREEDPDQLVTYANYPTAEYLPLDTLDFLTFNVFLEDSEDFRRYLTRLQHLAGDRPLVLGELGLHVPDGVDGERMQADTLDWQLETVVERGVAGACVFSWTDDWSVAGEPVRGWHFGLTRADRSPRPSLDVVARWNTRTVRDLDIDWPSTTVVICAYNAAETLDECLRHTCALDYPGLEILVVDDGSTDATVDIARRYPRARLLSIPHAGLAVARNEGFRAAAGEIVAYLDSDAYPSPEWPYFLALGFDGADVGGAGGPNLPPIDDAVGAHVVARSPGGPVHVLVSDDRAEHVPGCNMAFWKSVLVEVGGFDPIYRSAGDDVDLCWKVLDRNWAIGFHPAAVVWHHRRPGLRRYLRQQRSYGHSEALVEARHPDRFTPAGTARWRGRIYNSLAPSLTRQRVYRGLYGTAAYQSVYRGGGTALDLLHQVGVPLSVAALATAPLAGVTGWLGLPALLAAGVLAVLFVVDMANTTPPRGITRGRLRFRADVAVHHLLQPIVRAWARARHRNGAFKDVGHPDSLPAPVRRAAGGVVVVPEEQPRVDFAAALVKAIRSEGVHGVVPTGWEDYDSRLLLSPFVLGELQTSSHPVGFVQVRLRPRLRLRRVAAVAIVVAAAVRVSVDLAVLVGVPVTAGILYGLLRSRAVLVRAFRRSAT